MTSTSWPALKPLTVIESPSLISSPLVVNSRTKRFGRATGLLEVAELGLGDAMLLLVEDAELDGGVAVVVDGLDLENRVRFGEDDGDGRDGPGLVVDAGHSHLLS